MRCHILKRHSSFKRILKKCLSTKPPPESSSFMMNIFRGQIKPDEVFPFKNVLTEDQKMTLHSIVPATEDFLKEHNDAAKNDQNEVVDPKTMEGLRHLGAFGMQTPEKYGGLGLTNSQLVRLNNVIGMHDLGLGIVLGAHQSIGFKGITIFGNEEQKMKYLPLCTSGEKIAAFCLTEPSSGSDAGSIQSRAVLSDDGSHFILNGSKLWISNGGIADIFTVFAQTNIVDPKTGISKDKVSAFIVDRAFPGVTSGPPEKKMGIKCSNTAAVFFDNVKIPKENLLGELGSGFKIAMTILNNGRFGMAAVLAGTMRLTIARAVEHASSRKQFGQNLESFGTIQEKISRMTILQYVTETMAFVLAGNMDSGCLEYQVEAAISKIYGSEAAWYVCDEAIQILGGAGFMRDVGLERIMRDLRIFRIFEGTNEILRLFVALTGIQYAGGHLKELQGAFKNPTANLGLIFSEGSKRALRLVGVSSNESLTKYVHKNLAESAEKVSTSIEDFGLAVESLLFKYGKGVIEKQFLLNRLSNAAIEIYAMVIVLSRVSYSIENNIRTADHETMIANIVCLEGQERVKWLLRSLRGDQSSRTKFQQLSRISKEVVENGGVITLHPVGF